MKINDLIPIMMDYPELYNSVSCFLNKKFDIKSAELSLICSYVTVQYLKTILSKQHTINSWDLEDPDIIYVSDILNMLKKLEGKDEKA